MGKNDEEKQEDMIAEFYPHIFDSIKDIPVPDNKQIKDPKTYQKSLDEWIVRKLHL